MLDGLFALRAIAVFLGLGACALVVWKHEQTLSLLKKFFGEPSSPLNLGIVRIVVFATLYQSALLSDADFLARLPRAFLHLPRGWVWLADTGLLEPSVVHAARITLIWTTAAATVGLVTPVATVLASASALLVFGVENFYFKIGHSLHVPVLSACVLAASPAGDALSIDALVRRLRKQPPFAASRAYTVPVRFCWLLVGTMYLFPGLWKLWESGDQWLDGSKLANEMFDKWAQLPDFTPTVRLDRARTLLIVLGAWTLVLEIGFFFMLFARATRVVAAFLASSFHVGIGFTLGIWFSPFVPLILLADVPQIFELRALRPLARVGQKLGEPLRRILRLASAETTRVRSPRWAAAAFVVGAVWLGSMFVAGLGPVDSWPVAVYPRFADRKKGPTSHGMALGVFVVHRDGSELELPTALDVLGDPAAVYRVARTVIRARHRKDYKTLTQYEDLFIRLAERVYGRLQSGEQLRVLSYDFPSDPSERTGRGKGSFVLETNPAGSEPSVKAAAPDTETESDED